MTKPSIVAKIESRGFYRVNFRPVKKHHPPLRIDQCRDLVRDNATHLRGWDYPHYPSREGNDSVLTIAENYCEGWVDWANYKELWRMYQSSQFLHYAALREDWPEDAMWRAESHYKPGQIINAIGSLFYVVAEIFEFLSRLMRAGLYEQGATISILLSGTMGRRLLMDSGSGRMLHQDYTCKVPTLTFEAVVPADRKECMATAFKAAEYFVHRFGWLQPSEEVLKELVNDYMDRGHRR